jgi:hypothetical protein
MNLALLLRSDCEWADPSSHPLHVGLEWTTSAYSRSEARGWIKLSTPHAGQEQQLSTQGEWIIDMIGYNSFCMNGMNTMLDGKLRDLKPQAEWLDSSIL